MKKFYHCFDGMHVPLVEIINDKVLVKCPKNNAIKEFKVNEYCKDYIKICTECGNTPFYSYKNNCYCKNCFNNSIFQKKSNYNLYNSYCCLIHNENYIKYCFICDKNLCEICSCDHQNARWNKPDKNIDDINIVLENFINSIQLKIKEAKDIITKIESKLSFYESLLTKNNYIIIREMIINLQNLKIINDINEKEKNFINKINEIIKELESLRKFDFYNESNDKLKNDKLELKKDNKEKNYQKISSLKITNYDRISIINNIFTNYNNNVINKSLVYKKRNNLNQSINLISKTKNILESSNVETQIIFNDSSKIKFLYERYSLKKENIENKMKNIINKVINICFHLEDTKKLNEKNIFIFSIGHIAREAIKYSNDLAKILLDKFYENNNFSTIVYEKAKIEFSSWVNQILCFLDDNKDIRVFFDFYCKKENMRIQKYLQNEEKIQPFYNDNNFNFQILFRVLTQLYTEVLLCSEKKIEIKFFKDKDYKNDIMKDINDRKIGRFVKCTILPGLFVNNKVIYNGKALVFCGNKNTKNQDIPIFDTPTQKELEFKNTIKNSDLKDIKCNLIYDENTSKLIIKTVPEIPKNDHPKYSIISGKGREIQSKENNNEFSLISLKNKVNYICSIYGTVEFNGKKIFSKECYEI